jgi:hypothetical protein
MCGAGLVVADPAPVELALDLVVASCADAGVTHALEKVINNAARRHLTKASAGTWQRDIMNSLFRRLRELV